MARFSSGDYVLVEADDTIMTMFRTPKIFPALVIEKMTPDSQEEFYRLLWDGNLIVIPGVKMYLQESTLHTYTGEKNE